MRRPLRLLSAFGSARSAPVTVPAPYGGINGEDAIAGGMNPVDAVDLCNFVCIGGGVESRPGYTVRNSLGTGARVGFLHPLPDPSMGSIAASGGKLHLVATGTTQLGSGFASDSWRAAVMNGRLFLVNGSDAPRALSGTTLETPSFSGPAALAALHRVRAHARRLFFAERGSAKFWYTEAPGNVSGTLLPFDLSGVGNKGGVLEEIATLAPDGGAGGDDDAVAFFMSSGEAIVYRGSNPGDAASWGRVGVFPVARPIAVESHGGDVLTVSLDGYAELSRLLPSGRSPVAGFGSRIGRLAQSSVSAFGANAGWQVLYSPAQRIIIVHVPQTASAAQQHVYSLTAGAWSRWAGLPATVWGSVGEALCFGTGDGRICELGGDSDNGAAIVATAQAAWNPLGGPGRRKRVGLVKPIVTATSTPSIRHVLGVDFQPPVYGAEGTVPLAAGSGIWNQSVWNVATWGGSEQVAVEFRGGGAIGEWFAVGLRVDSRVGRVKWLATTLMVEAGV